MPSFPDLPEPVFANAAKHWDLDRLYQDLEKIKQHSLSATERSCLRGLLLGINPNEIAEKLHRQPQGLRVDLSRGMYQYIKALTQQAVKNWREIAIVLGAEYKLPATLPESSPGLLGNRSLSVPPLELATIQNLPIRDYSAMIGREREIEQLQTLLSYDCPVHCVSVEGTGGIGKTALALAVAYGYLNAPNSPFERLIFTSAKQHRLTPQGILPRLKPNPQRNLQDILRSIARTFQQPELLLTDLDEQLEQIQLLLARQHTLLIVDNLESVEDYQLILAFLYDLPPAVKTIITTRQQVPFETIRLEPLAEPAGIRLIQQQATMKRLPLTPTETQALYQQTSGIPAAIVYATGQLAAGYPLSQIQHRLTQSQGDYARFYFESSVVPLRGSLAHQLLMALSLFAESAATEALAFVVECADLIQLAEGLAELQQRSLVRQHNQRYDMLSLTKELTGTELKADPNIELQLRERWLEWYLHFAQEHGNKDWQEWQDYRNLEREWSNLQDAIEWCIEQNRYPEVRQFWQSVKGYTHMQGQRHDRRSCWDMRLDWTDWLLQTAEQQQDWQTALEIMLDQGWTLTLLGQSRHLERADALYQHAWELRHHKAPAFQTNLAIQIAFLHIERQQFIEAMEWLTQARQSTDLDPLAEQRQQLQLDYYEGSICYKTEDYHRAQLLFQQVLHRAEALQWQRAIFLAKAWLADIAIQQRNLDEAEAVFQEGLQVAEANQDECRAAFCRRSLARLEQARGNRHLAHQWAQSAWQGFEQLGMLTEAQETFDLLQTLAVE